MTHHHAFVVLVSLIVAGPAFAQVSPSAADKRDPRLSGIIVSPGQRCAIFAFDQDGVSLTASEGMTIGTWTIVGITEHAVEVATAAGNTFVTLDSMSEADKLTLRPVLATARQPLTGDAMFGVRAP